MPLSYEPNLGVFSNDAAALAHVVLNGWDVAGVPMEGMFYWNETLRVYRVWTALAWRTQASNDYDQVAIVPVRGRGWETVSLGVSAYTADFSVMQKRNFNDQVDGVMNGATNTTQLVDTTKDWRLTPITLGTATSAANTAAGTIQCASNIQTKFAVGSYVQNLRTMEIGRITGFTSAKIATVTGFASGHLNNDVFEFHESPNNMSVRNVTRGVNRGVTGFNPAAPSVLPLSAAIAGQVPGDVYAVYGQALWQWDEAGFNVMISAPSNNSDPPTTQQINIYNKSLYALEFIVRWRG